MFSDGNVDIASPWHTCLLKTVSFYSAPSLYLGRVNVYIPDSWNGPPDKRREGNQETADSNHFTAKGLEKLPACWWEQNRTVGIPLPAGHLCASRRWERNHRKIVLCFPACSSAQCATWRMLSRVLMSKQTHTCLCQILFKRKIHFMKIHFMVYRNTEERKFYPLKCTIPSIWKLTLKAS